VDYGLLFLHVTLGLTLAAHGAQKLFGWFGGGGLAGTGRAFGSLGFRAPTAMAAAAGLGEFLGGLSVALGFATTLGALALVIVMFNAIAAVNGKHGFFVQNHGFEFNLLIIVCAATLAASSAGRFSIDGALGWDDRTSGLWWAVGILAGAGLVAALTTAFGRTRQPTQLPQGAA
jgi:putative oxidoreductase